MFVDVQKVDAQGKKSFRPGRRISGDSSLEVRVLVDSEAKRE
jgi:hypothetical protein